MKLKAIADYETGPEAVVPLEEASAAVETADRFIRMVAELLDQIIARPSLRHVGLEPATQAISVWVPSAARC